MALDVQVFSHMAVLVSDLERSGAWYRDVLGWVPEMQGKLDDPNWPHISALGAPSGRMWRGTLGGVGLQLVQADAEYQPFRRTDHYGRVFLISVRVPDLDEARRHVEALGITPVREGIIGPTRMFILADPDGFEVVVLAMHPSHRP